MCSGIVFRRHCRHNTELSGSLIARTAPSIAKKAGLLKTILITIKHAPLILIIGTLTACAVGPDYTRPSAPDVDRISVAPLPAATTATDAPTGDAQRFLEGESAPAQWWLAFSSPELNRRVAQALAHNPTISAAQAALRAAQENANAAAGGYLPQIDAGVGATRQQTSTTQSGGGSPFTLYNASVNVSYTLDLFGGVRRGVEAQQAVANAQQFRLQGTYLSLAANVATASIREAALRAQLAASEDIVAALGEQESLAQKRFELGASSMIDTLAVRSQLAGARAALVPLRLQLEQLRNQLAVYLGKLPAQRNLQILALDEFTLPAQVPVSLPSQLVAQRPDIRAAAAQVHAATAELGIASANLLPRISLTGAWGSNAASASDLFSADSILWNLGAGLLQPLFHGGSLRADKRAAQARLEQAAAEYRFTVLSAFQDVANALQALQLDAEALKAQSAAMHAAQSNLDLVNIQYDTGATGYLQVLDATRQFQQAKLAFIQARAARLTDTVALYAALGGGWNASATSPIDAAAASQTATP